MLDAKELVIGLGIEDDCLQAVAQNQEFELHSYVDLSHVQELPEQICFNCDVLIVHHTLLDGLGDHELQQVLSKFPFATSIVGFNLENNQLIGELLSKGLQDYILLGPNLNESGQRIKSRALECRLRRNRASYYVGHIEVDVARRLLLRDKKTSSLSPTEMNLLHCLAMANGNIIPRQTLKRVCWGQEVSDNALNRKLHEVRKSLKSLDKDVEIRTIYGTGFRLDIGSMRSTNSMPRI